MTWVLTEFMRIQRFYDDIQGSQINGGTQFICIHKFMTIFIICTWSTIIYQGLSNGGTQFNTNR